MKKFVKNGFLLVLFVLFSTSVFAETVQLKITTSTGAIVYQDVEKETTFWGAMNGDSVNYKFASVSGLEQLPNLEIIEFQNIDTVEDFSFLSSAKNLKELYMTNCSVNSLKFIEKLGKLKMLDLNVLFQTSASEAVELTRIDLGKLHSLQELRFSAIVVDSNKNAICKLTEVPKFKNVKSVPLLDISNNDIKAFSDEDVKLLNQYSEVFIKYNPVSTNAAELVKLKKIYYTAE
ncbi:MAG: hypothetical protein MJ188_01515 [Treponema sp.]|nr:hypothetical protein [Treponema sp.]